MGSPTCDGLVHRCQRLPRQAPVLPGHVPEGAHVAALQERDVRLADGYVLWRRILVQLLVPLLDEATLDALQDRQRSCDDRRR